MKFAQEMNCLFFATFVGSFATHLLGDSTSAFILSCIVAGSAVAPRILTVSLTTRYTTTTFNNYNTHSLAPMVLVYSNRVDASPIVWPDGCFIAER